MPEPLASETDTGGEWLRGIAVILLVGSGLGIGFNALLQRGSPSRALAWVREEKKLASIEEVLAEPAAAVTGETPADGTTPSDAAPSPSLGTGTVHPDTPVPLPGPSRPATTPSATAPGTRPATTPATGTSTQDPATGTGTVVAAEPSPKIVLPHIPDSRDPLEAQIGIVKKFHDAGAALFVDSRSREEYATSHIAGAVNLPFDDTFKEPSLVTSFRSGGKPVIIYCGGGECELSKNLAYALIEAGHKKVLVFMSGLPEWEKSGYAIVKGATP